MQVLVGFSALSSICLSVEFDPDTGEPEFTCRKCALEALDASKDFRTNDWEKLSGHLTAHEDGYDKIHDARKKIAPFAPQRQASVGGVVLGGRR